MFHSEDLGVVWCLWLAEITRKYLWWLGFHEIRRTRAMHFMAIFCVASSEAKSRLFIYVIKSRRWKSNLFRKCLVAVLQIPWTTVLNTWNFASLITACPQCILFFDHLSHLLEKAFKTPLRKSNQQQLHSWWKRSAATGMKGKIRLQSLLSCHGTIKVYLKHQDHMEGLSFAVCATVGFNTNPTAQKFIASGKMLLFWIDNTAISDVDVVGDSLKTSSNKTVLYLNSH